MKANQPIFYLLISAILCSCASNSKAQTGKDLLEALDLIDYSYAGYDFGESELPTAYDLPVFKVEDFGAAANDDISDQEAIQKAIRKAEAAKGGVVLFGSGKYIINETKGKKKGILINASNVILKGAGSGENGTVLHMKEPLAQKYPDKLWTTPPMISFRGKGGESIKGSLAGDVKLGDKSIMLKGPHGLKKGDLLLIKAQGTFLNDRLLEGKKTRKIWTTINEKGAVIHEIHQVAKVSGKKVTFKAPVLVDMNIKEPWELEKLSFIENCGFEDIRF